MSFLLSLHSTFRWAILILLLIIIIRHLTNKGKDFTKDDKIWSLRLLIFAHLQFLMGMVQYFVGEKGYKLIEANGMKDCMKTPVLRFWVVEHITGMLISVILITIANSITKKAVAGNLVAKRNSLFIINLLALIIIIAVIPWPFREMFNGMPYIRY